MSQNFLEASSLLNIGKTRQLVRDFHKRSIVLSDREIDAAFGLGIAMKKN